MPASITWCENDDNFRNIMESVPVSIFVIQQGSFKYVNRNVLKKSGYAEEDLIGRLNPLDLIAPEYRDEVSRNLRERLDGVPGHPYAIRILRKDGTCIDAIAWSAMIQYHGSPAIAGTLIDITERITAQKEIVNRIDRLAHYDNLTGLFNRESLCDRLALAIEDARREHGQVAVVSFDLDRFKDINDSLGHRVGDHILKQLVERLRDCCRGKDSVGRMGGDEFAAVLVGANTGAATRVGQKLLRLVKEPFTVYGRQLTLTCSVGIAIFPADGDDVETLLRNADAAQHHAETIGGDNFQFFAVKMNAAALQHLTLVNELREAVQQGELELYYQPQVRLADGIIDGAEALVRWRHPQRGLIPPSEFIPIAEESGIIVDIGQWVLREACRQAKAWQQEDLSPIPVAVNLSAVQFHRGNVLEQVRTALLESGLEPRYLELELTESVILQGMDDVQKVLQQLAEMEVSVSIDDFGTGYSSFTYLRKLHIDKLKIDQSFVRGVNDNEEDSAIVNATIALARAFKLNVVAEGVETAEQYRFVKEAGCDQVQGYYCSKPLDVEHFKKMLEQGCPNRAV